MPRTIEIDGKQEIVWTQAEHDQDVAGLKVTLEHMKQEKEEIKGKLSEAKESALAAEEAKAKALGDNEELQRIANEREAEKDRKLNELLGSIRKEKSDNVLNTVVSKLGAGGEKNEDLRDLIKARFSIDYDTTNHEIVVKGDGVSSVEELEAAITSSGRYDAYLAGSKASGGGSGS